MMIVYFCVKDHFISVSKIFDEVISQQCRMIVEVFWYIRQVVASIAQLPCVTGMTSNLCIDLKPLNWYGNKKIKTCTFAKIVLPSLFIIDTSS